MNRFFQCLVFVGLLLLSACAGGNKQEDPGVEDIQPGDQSVIQSPSYQAPAKGDNIGEKNI